MRPTDGQHRGLNSNQIIQREEGQLVTDGLLFPQRCPTTLDFGAQQDNRRLAKEETVVAELFFSANPAAAISANTF